MAAILFLAAVDTPREVRSSRVLCVVLCSVTKERTEVVFEGTLDSMPGQRGELAQWQEIEFKCKPGSVDRRPCIISPYHYRLDWLMWFAAFQVREGETGSVQGKGRGICEGR